MTKADIINSAFTVWGQNHYLNTSLSSLAQELGVSKAALYRHFKNKQALLDAMYEHFFDDYTNYIRDDYNKALETKDKLKSFNIINRSIMKYYLCNPMLFAFSLILVYKNRNTDKAVEQLHLRNMNMEFFNPILKNETGYPSLIQLIVATLLYFIAQFHHQNYLKGQKPTEEAINNIITATNTTVGHGLALDKETVGKLDYKKLENNIANIPPEPVNDILHQAVAAAVAEAGPWNVSMEMIASRCGLSKSGLYAHYKNKQDILNKFFSREFERIVTFSKTCTKNAATPEEKLYLTIISIANYLRSQPEILLSIEWTRARQFNIKHMISPRFDWILSNIKIKRKISSGENSIADQIAQWIFFLIINTLIRRSPGMDYNDVSYDSFRFLFRFISLGLEGLNN